MQRRTFIRHAGLGLSALTAATATFGQDASKNTILYVGYPPGGSPDLVARTISRRLGELLDRNIIIENRTGAAGNLAMEAVKHAPPDGSALVLSPSPPVVLAPLLYPKLPYRVPADFSFIGRVVNFELALVVHTNHPAKTAREFIEWARKNPANANYAVPGVGSTPHFLGYLIGKSGGFDYRVVGYRGGPQLMTDLLGGHVTSAISVLSNFVQDHRKGTLRVLATTGAQRSALLPEVPTLAEAFDMPAMREATTVVEWYGMLAPAGTPAPMLQKIYAAIADTMKDKAIHELLASQGHDPAPMPGPQFSDLVLQSQDRWGKVIKESGFKLES